MFSLNKSVSKLKALKQNKDRIGSDVSESPKRVKNKKSKSSVSYYCIEWALLDLFVFQVRAQSEVNPGRVVRGVIKISNIPHGFYEKQMSEYFSQFGKVLRVRIFQEQKGIDSYDGTTCLTMWSYRLAIGATMASLSSNAKKWPELRPTQWTTILCSMRFSNVIIMINNVLYWKLISIQAN